MVDFIHLLHCYFSLSFLQNMKKNSFKIMNKIALRRSTKFYLLARLHERWIAQFGICLVAHLNSVANIIGTFPTTLEHLLLIFCNVDTAHETLLSLKVLPISSFNCIWLCT